VNPNLHPDEFGDVDLTEGGLDEASIRRPPTHLPVFKELVRRDKGEGARASEGEDMAKAMGYGMGSPEELDRHLAEFHGGGNVRNPAQSHLRYHVEYQNPVGPPHQH
jgi:hypothetical protein